MVSWHHAFTGITHGVPGLRQTAFESVQLDDEWVGVKLPQEIMFELLRTPTYSTWQGERWLFCCRQAMTYRGSWSREQFDQHADGDGQRLFNEIVEYASEEMWDYLEEKLSVYVFECKTCGKFRSHWDSD